MCEEVEATEEQLKQEISTALATQPAQDEFAQMDKYDEQQILAELKQSVSGEVRRKWWYQCRGGGIEITYNAVRAWAAMRAKEGAAINIEDVEQVTFNDKVEALTQGVNAGIYTVDEAKETLRYYTEHIFIQVKSIDTVTGQTRYGYAEQPIFDSSRELDEFAFRKACGKAQRNAIKEHMTAEEKASIILMARQQGQTPIVLKKTPAKTTVTGKKEEKPPAPMTEEQRDEIEFSLAEKGITLKDVCTELSEKHEKTISPDIDSYNTFQAEWLIKEIKGL